ncbi:neutral zinc metallopeptidase [Nocardia pseudobrasiliensis]|nr:neutral zinc metallopeptidase [Nocardia pseudobrasiliensis]
MVVYAGMDHRGHRSSERVAPSYTYAPPTWETTTAAVTTTYTAPTTTLPPTRTTRPAPTTTKPAGPQPVVATGDNPLFRHPESGLNNIACDYPAWRPNVAAARAYFLAGIGCLDQMWSRLLRSENLPFSSPQLSVTAHASEASSPCGTHPQPVAYYCSANYTIYMPLDSIFTNEDPNDPIIYLAILSHEYGHHVQAVSGIMTRENRDRSTAGPTSALGLELSRRLELGAQCFGGMFVGSSNYIGTVTEDQAGRALYDNYHRGDQPGDMRDHGTEAHNGGWFETGYRNNRTQQCNTWLAASGDVS